MSFVKVPNFLQMEAPPNYVAGLGRGASGFTTRSDIGPAREGPTSSYVLHETKHNLTFSSEAAAGITTAPQEREEQDEPETYQDPDNEMGLFSGAPYEADDREADQIYDAIDSKMEERRRSRKEAKEQEDLDRSRQDRPKLQQQFADAKRALADMSEDDWAALPEVGDLVGKNKKRAASNRERSYITPDTLLASARDSIGFENSLDSQQMKNGGYDTSIDPSGMQTNFVEIGQARDKMLSIKLDQAGKDSISGSTTIDPKGYLTDLNSIMPKSDAEIGDIKKARLLLNSVIQTNKKHAPGWIAAARLEEFAGKMAQARKIIQQGCDYCQKNEDIWLEAARLNTPENAKVILAEAVRQLPKSVSIWLKAVSLEKENKSRKIVLRKALEFIPNSVRLWKEAINEEENPEDAKVLLARAVELAPLSIELWLAFARLEKYDKAKAILNKAVSLNRTSHEIWLAAAKLDEHQGGAKLVDKIVSQAVKTLTTKGVMTDRELWLQQAEECEKQGSVLTCQAIVRNTIGMNVEEEDRKHTWMDDAERCIAHGAIDTARAVYAHALQVFPEKKSIWRRAANLEKAHGTQQSLDELLARSVTFCPHAEVLWLMRAKEKWVSGNVNDARAILKDAFAANPNSESIWLAAVKMEAEGQQYETAQKLLERARTEAGTERVWMKSVMLERQIGNADKALDLVNQAIEKHADFDKLHMIKGQILTNQDKIQEARQAYAVGMKNCPKSVPLWILAANLEERTGVMIRARSILERALLVNPKNPELWRESIKTELRKKNTAQAKALLSKALQECPTSGALWSEAIWMEPRAARKSKSVDALRKNDSDPIIIATVARLFWAERNIDKARNWFQKAIKVDSDIGDCWAWWYKFELQHGTEAQQGEVINQCVAADPHHGELWPKILKDLANIGKSTEEILKLTTAKIE